MSEFVEEDCGFVVQYLDVRAMAERVIHLLDSAECRLKMGAAARAKWQSTATSVSRLPRIMNII